MVYTPSGQFEAAAAYLTNSPALSKVSNDVKLELYALFKCITVSKNPTVPRPSLFDFAGRAKWDAWDKLGKQSDKKETRTLEERYLEIAQSLGWRDGLEHDLINEDDDVSSDGGSERRTGGSGGGMGIAVSVMPQPPPDSKDDGTLHAFALSGDADGLLSFLRSHSNIKINGLDDYGYTPLHLAADRGNASVVRVLIEEGADVTIQDPDEFNALALAEVGGHDEIVEMIRGHTAP